MNRRCIIFFFLSLVLITACEETVRMPLSAEDSNLLVVQGVLTNEKINHQIKLTLPYKTPNGIPAPAIGAVVSVIEESNAYSLVEFPPGSGEYYTPEIRAVAGKTYSLLIQYKGKQYFASDSPVAVEPLEELQYEKVNDVYAFTFNSSGQSPNFIVYYAGWSHTEACTASAGCEGILVQYDLKTIDANEIFKPEKKDFYFPVNTVVIRKKYSVSPAYKTFLRSMLSETEWRGGLFDVQRADVSTNLSEGAVGFFAVSTVVADTTLIVEKL